MNIVEDKSTKIMHTKIQYIMQSITMSMKNLDHEDVTLKFLPCSKRENTQLDEQIINF